MWSTYIRRYTSLILFLIVITANTIALASEKEISAVGSYTMGQDDTLQKAQDTALNEALRTAAEQIGDIVKNS